MNEIAVRWRQQSSATRAVILAGAALLAIVIVWKILPLMLAAMGVGLLLTVLFVPYWAPTIVAFIRHHPSKGAVLALNFFVGWTFIGWVLSLVWALSNNSGQAGQPAVVVNNNFAQQPAPFTQAPAQYRVGDVVGSQRFDGTRWVELPQQRAAMDESQGNVFRQPEPPR